MTTPTVLDFISSALTALQYPAIPCKDAGEALALLQNKTVVAVLSDIRMPGFQASDLLNEFVTSTMKYR